jgi:hypothetical protein
MVLAAVPGVAARGLAGAAGAAAAAVVVVVVEASGAGSQLVLGRPSYTWAEDCCMLSYEHTVPTDNTL